MTPKIKSPKALVSKKKRRYIDSSSGFDLDLSYVGGDTTCTSSPDTSASPIHGPLRDENGRGRIIAMGFPAEGLSTAWRNPLSEVRRFLELNHLNRYRVYNLCSENGFHSSLEKFGDRCQHFGFDDRNPCPLEMIAPFCRDVHSWLGKDEGNVAALHCRAGKGRTGMMISCYLLHAYHYRHSSSNSSSDLGGGLDPSGRDEGSSSSGKVGCRIAEEALTTFGNDRTKNGRGVTIPSQMRYVGYYQRVLEGFDVKPKSYRIERVKLNGVPDFASLAAGGGCDPFLRVTEATFDPSAVAVKKNVVYDQRKRTKGKIVKHYGKSKDGAIELDCSHHDVIVCGDVKLSIYHQELSWPKSKKSEMCRVWFHTAFLEGGGECSLSLGKTEIDRASKDKKSKVFDPSFGMDIFLREVEMRAGADSQSQEERSA